MIAAAARVMPPGSARHADAIAGLRMTGLACPQPGFRACNALLDFVP